uniref:protein MRG1-like n=1 Tax=Erigeron canadensis TaxID=72917 RepID=UPI001CB8E44E|nr:protein MRG1-like [Erigeron canadensis]
MLIPNVAITYDDNNSSVTASDNDDNAKETGSKNDVVPYSKGEKVLAYHCRLIYDAKVLDVDSGGTCYLVHYIGWKKKYDEWVGMDHLMKYNQENVLKQIALEKEHPLEVTKSGRALHLKLKNPKGNLLKQKALEKEHPLDVTKSGRALHLKRKNPNETRGRKRKRMTKGTASYGKLIDLQIPPTLKKHLVNHWEYITHMGKLVKLPCSPNIDDILKLYLEQQSNKDDRASDLAGEILSGIRCYFDQALPAMLLYKGERQQHEEATANEVSPSKIYGAEHLLRLFVKLPEILHHANIEKEILTKLQHRLQDFLKFLLKNESPFFQPAYETPDGSCTIE